jgi:putative ABC transport system ATP-binding protein
MVANQENTSPLNGMSPFSPIIETATSARGGKGSRGGWAVACQNVRKSFGKGENQVEVLRGVDFEVPFGEMSLLVGPSGCGKTTLLSVIAGLLDATGGNLEVLGQDLGALKGRSIEFRRRNLGFVFQQYNLLPALTAAENAAVPLLAAGVKRKEAVDKARHLLKQLGMEKRSGALPKELSGGQQQRVALARALIHDPRLLVCDEPTSALDAETGHAVMELLRNVAVREDRAVVVVTHDSRVFTFADRIAYMDDGRIVKTELRRPRNLAHAS